MCWGYPQKLWIIPLPVAALALLGSMRLNQVVVERCELRVGQEGAVGVAVGAKVSGTWHVS